MADTMREKLIELVNDVLDYLPWGEIASDTANNVADHLIANGVTVQELNDGAEHCLFCSAEHTDWEKYEAHDFRIKGNALFYHDYTFGWEGITISYCPMCGRKLPEHPKENTV